MQFMHGTAIEVNSIVIISYIYAFPYLVANKSLKDLNKTLEHVCSRVVENYSYEYIYTYIYILYT